VVQVPDLRFGAAPTIDPAPGIDPAGDAKALISSRTRSPAQEAIPGTIVYYREDSGRRHFLRLPDVWNGSLVVAGTPATRSEFANDAIWSDFALARGYAFASSNKGIRFNVILEAADETASPRSVYPIPFGAPGFEDGTKVLRFGVLDPRAIRIEEWNEDFRHLIEFARDVLRLRRDALPHRTYAVGLSNGGAQVRAALERFPELLDGGVEYAGVRWTPERSFLDILPPFLAAMPAYIQSGFTDPVAKRTIEGLGFPADVLQPENVAHPSLWCDWYSNAPPFYNDLMMFVYPLLIDPEASAYLGEAPVLPNAEDPRRLPGVVSGKGLVRPEFRAAYVPSRRAREAIRAFAHSGGIERPLISLAGTKDVLITPEFHAIGYAKSVADAGRAHLHRLYLVENGTHVDTFADFGYGLQAQLPFAWAAFDELVRTVEMGDLRGVGTTKRVVSPTEIGSGVGA
jgi:pimeloyl-ACP methyl ester carboxylesterase